ncbi:MAG: hypothetical protein IH884_04870 [Myxococcales bacterium]|nr:hypothetical protein [Myxococcales bacterium]
MAANHLERLHGLAHGPGGGLGLVLPQLPGEDYDLRVTFTRLAGSFGPFLVLPIADHQVGLSLSIFDPRVSGLGLVDGKDVKDNPTAVSGSLENNRRYVLEVAVRVAGERADVRVRLDGRHYTSFHGNAKSLTLTRYYAVPDKTQIALGAQTASVRFHSVKLRRRSP